MKKIYNNTLYDIGIHSLNVSKYALLLGNELNLDEYDLKILKIGGLLHDIGKIFIPEEILNKNTSLTDKEFEIIKKHPILGELLLPTKISKEIKEIVRNHHERIDGNGYPDGLKNNEISYYTKIISIADSFDAMTSKRSYNNVKTIDEALNELYKCSIPTTNEKTKLIQQFDTNLVNIFIKAIKNNQSEIEHSGKTKYKDFKLY